MVWKFPFNSTAMPLCVIWFYPERSKVNKTKFFEIIINIHSPRKKIENNSLSKFEPFYLKSNGKMSHHKITYVTKDQPFN